MKFVYNLYNIIHVYFLAKITISKTVMLRNKVLLF